MLGSAGLPSCCLLPCSLASTARRCGRQLLSCLRRAVPLAVRPSRLGSCGGMQQPLRLLQAAQRLPGGGRVWWCIMCSARLLRQPPLLQAAEAIPAGGSRGGWVQARRRNAAVHLGCYSRREGLKACPQRLLLIRSSWRGRQWHRVQSAVGKGAAALSAVRQQAVARQLLGRLASCIQV